MGSAAMANVEPSASSCVTATAISSPNEWGELIIAKFSPRGYHEISRMALIKPTSIPDIAGELGAVNWTHPAYANRRIGMRNDEEIISLSLEKPR